MEEEMYGDEVDTQRLEYGADSFNEGEYEEAMGLLLP